MEKFMKLISRGMKEKGAPKIGDLFFLFEN